MTTQCGCDILTGECQGPLGCKAVAEIERLKADVLDLASRNEAMLQYLETAIRAKAVDDGVMQLKSYLPLAECLTRWRRNVEQKMRSE